MRSGGVTPKAAQISAARAFVDVVGSCACGSESCQWCGIAPPPAPVVARYRCIPILPVSEEHDRLMAALLRGKRSPLRKPLRKAAPRGTWSDDV